MRRWDRSFSGRLQAPTRGHTPWSASSVMFLHFLRQRNQFDVDNDVDNDIGDDDDDEDGDDDELGDVSDDDVDDKVNGK